MVIVAFDSGAYLQACVDALAAQRFADFEAVIADNGSTDGSIEALGLPDGRFRVLPMGFNAGFAAANNRVAEASRSEFLALLNPDASPDPGWLGALVDAARANPGAASVGSLQLQMADPSRLDGLGDVWHVAGLAWRAGEGLSVAGAPGDGEIFGPCAAAALYRRAAFLAAGGFDERYFCYCEDVDLAFRLRLAGHSSVRAAGAIVRHAGSGISGRASDFTIFHGHRNRVWTFVKNTPGVWFWLFLPYHLAYNALMLASAVRRGRFRPLWRAYRAALLGVGPFWRERRVRRPRRIGFVALLKVMAWTPWAPIRRDLVPWR